jgi:iron only hydrogenase large subunit-like protein
MKDYLHSVVLDYEKCIGCTNCMRRCPTEAIRVRNKKAVIIKERCIDCGECIRVCPSHAQNSITDDLVSLNEFKYNIAIPSVSLYGQFTTNTDMNKVYQGIKSLGFDYVFDEGIAADILSKVIKEMLKSGSLPKPVISSFCPAVLRLIQVRFPSLIDNIITVESPMEVAGRIVREKAVNELGYKPEEVGVFYLTSCPAKVTSIKKPIGIKKSSLNGSISIKEIYGDIVKKMKDITQVPEFDRASSKGIMWGIVGGQGHSIGLKNYIAVDGIENVIGILEEMELGKLNSLDYFEGFACVGGCVGGPLNIENSFISKSVIKKISANSPNVNQKYIDDAYISSLVEKGFIDWVEKIEPKGILTLDENIQKAIEKLEKIKQISQSLPGLDCGSCGAPTCRALAEDTVRGFGSANDCIIRSKQK